MKKLTKTQIEVLRKLGEPGAVANHMPYMGSFRPNPYWYISGGQHIRKGVTEKLIALGYLKRIQKGFEDATAVITDLGRAALAEVEGK